MKEKIIAKLRTKSFWVALVGVAAMVLGLFGIEDVSEPLGRMVEAVGSLLVLTGIIASPASKDSSQGETKVGETEDGEKPEDQADISETTENGENDN